MREDQDFPTLALQKKPEKEDNHALTTGEVCVLLGAVTEEFGVGGRSAAMSES